MRISVFENMRVWFTADPHFNHGNIINLCNRPYDNVEHMNRNLIENWNNVVGKDDYVFCIGDFSYKGSGNKVNKIISELRGNKFFIKGNHESDLMNSNYKDLVHERIELIYRDKLIVLDHYPLLVWNQSHRGSYNFFGHVHGGLSNKGIIKHSKNQIDVGVDCHNYTPIDFDFCERIIESRTDYAKV